MEDMFVSPKLVLRDLHLKLSKSEIGFPISSCLTFHFLLICFFVFLDSLDGPILSATFPRQTHHCRMELSQTCEVKLVGCSPKVVNHCMNCWPWLLVLFAYNVDTDIL